MRLYRKNFVEEVCLNEISVKGHGLSRLRRKGSAFWEEGGVSHRQRYVKPNREFENCRYFDSSRVQCKEKGWKR